MSAMTEGGHHQVRDFVGELPQIPAWGLQLWYPQALLIARRAWSDRSFPYTLHGVPLQGLCEIGVPADMFVDSVSSQCSTLVDFTNPSVLDAMAEQVRQLPDINMEEDPPDTGGASSST